MPGFPRNFVSNTGFSPVPSLHYVYDGPHVIAEFEDAGSGPVLTRKYIYAPALDEPICLLDLTGQTPAVYFYYYDGLGSVTALSNVNKQIVERYVYDAFGKTRILSPNYELRTQSLFGNPILFTGRRLDGETGLYDYRARIYSPALGRFLQTDPIGYADSMNLYQYCGNNPVNWIDPWGLNGVPYGPFGPGTFPVYPGQKPAAGKPQIDLAHEIDHAKLALFEWITDKGKARHIVDPFNQNKDTIVIRGAEKEADRLLKLAKDDFLKKERDKHNKRFHPEPPVQPKPEPETKKED